MHVKPEKALSDGLFYIMTPSQSPCLPILLPQHLERARCDDEMTEPFNEMVLPLAFWWSGPQTLGEGEPA